MENLNLQPQIEEAKVEVVQIDTFTSLEEIMIMTAKENAVGKELKYFWNNSEKVIVKHRRNIIRTLLELHSKKETDNKVITAEGDYQVKEYVIPAIEWIKAIVNYSHRIYLTNVAKTNEVYLTSKSRPMFAADSDVLAKGEVLSPSSLKKALQQIVQYNEEYKTTVEISKNPIAFCDLHGVFKDFDTYRVIDRTKDRAYSQLLAIQMTDFLEYTGADDKLSDDALVRIISNGELGKKAE